ncbi:glycosyltransferase family 58 protein [Schizophyllum amplum]|uniref:Dol-P-Man:Man(5)GlcNAc(2)-PP-Dol alpha-1,3-mannosyltransferase n=1 Tax=Schizophyllum amplum TaxID=97359 RepID=A0A550CAQ8_9AGAR|nr:glycosyltransferase family 58 protein [Auriculariopsis ampla]
MQRTVALNCTYQWVKTLLLDRRYFAVVAITVLLGDAILTQLITRFIPYTEIDWGTYMKQAKIYMEGERDYTKISGPTGPLVYPAGHVYIHEWLYSVTDAGKNMRLAQQLYSLLYIVSQCLNCAIYHRAGAPNWLVLSLPLSKRLHSIYVLRLFNDCWAVIAAQAAILAYQSGADLLGTVLLSGGISVKMSVILYVPGLLVVLFKRRGLLSTLGYAVVALVVQVSLALPFLKRYPKEYLGSAFDLSRVFLYKWTVNWRFVPEDAFLSPQFAKALLVGHATALIAFGLFRWCRADGGAVKVLERGFRRPSLAAGIAPVDSSQIATILLTSNLIGVTFARSLHYQFYSWYAQQMPFLAWKSRQPVWLKITAVLAIEYAWNVYPSTRLSSTLLLCAHSCILLGMWFRADDQTVRSAHLTTVHSK